MHISKTESLNIFSKMKRIYM